MFICSKLKNKYRKLYDEIIKQIEKNVSSLEHSLPLCQVN